MVRSWPAVALVAPDAALVIDEVERCQELLLDAELSLADNVTAARLRELKAGRTSARRAIQCLGAQPAAILANPHGAPLWPPGLCGSLSHSYRYVAALVARSRRYDSVGIDICDGRPLDASALAEIASTDELHAVERAGLTNDGRTPAGIVFSAKEAIYKCQYPLTLDSSLDFRDVAVLPSGQPQVFEVQALSPARVGFAGLASRLRIHLSIIQGVTLVYALLCKPAGHDV